MSKAIICPSRKKHNPLGVYLLAFSIIIIHLVCCGSAYSWFFREHCPKDYVLGEVVKVDLHVSQISIKDEQEGTVFVFYAHQKTIEPFAEGERVRAYFRCGNNLLRSIKKMTVLDKASTPGNQGHIYSN